MFDQLEEWILSTLQTVFDLAGWWGVAGMMVFENATGITPSEIILGMAGWMLIERHGLPVTFIFQGGLYAALASLVGSSITYWAARIGGRPLVYRLAGWVRISPDQIRQAEEQFHRWGSGLVFFGRMVPAVRTLISIPAGLARMPFGRFALATFLGAYLWCTLLIGAGFWLGEQYHMISDLIARNAPVLLLAAVAGLALLMWLRGPGREVANGLYRRLRGPVRDEAGD